MLDYPHNFPLWEVSTCVFFAFPMVIMAILYMRMGLKIRSRTRHTVALGKKTNNKSYEYYYQKCFVIFTTIVYYD